MPTGSPLQAICSCHIIQYSPMVQRHDAYNTFAETGHSFLENQRIISFRQILKIPQELKVSQTASHHRRKKILLSASYSSCSPSTIQLADSSNENNILENFYWSQLCRVTSSSGKQQRSSLLHEQNLLTKFQLQDQKPTNLSVAAITLNLMIIGLNRCVNQGRI